MDPIVYIFECSCILLVFFFPIFVTDNLKRFKNKIKRLKMNIVKSVPRADSRLEIGKCLPKATLLQHSTGHANTEAWSMIL